MLYGGCTSKHSSVFPAGLGKWASSQWEGKMVLQTFPQSGRSHWVWLKMPMTFRCAFFGHYQISKDI